MRIKKLIIAAIAFILYTNTFAQTQSEMLEYLRKNIRVFYIANPNVESPDIRSISPASIISSSEIIFGQKNNNGMNNSAQLLLALFGEKGDVRMQSAVFKALQQSKKPIVIHFINDVNSPIDPKYLNKYNYYVIRYSARTFVWPAVYTATGLTGSGINNAIVMGEYHSRSIATLKILFNDLVEKIAAGKYGPAHKDLVTAAKVRTITRYKGDLPKLTKAQEDRWWDAQTNRLGVIGNDYDGRDEIGTAPAERTETVFETNRLNFWYPNLRTSENKRAYKQTLIGKVTNAVHYENDIVFPDFDIDMYVIPDPKFQFLIDEGRKPTVNLVTRVGNLIHGSDCPAKFTTVEAEIDLRDIHEKQFPAVLLDEMKRSSDHAGFYGVWLWDRGHCEQPEIHPAEQIWWSYKTESVFTYRCHLTADYSNRYITRDQYDDADGTVMKPWAEPPIDGVFAIPFAVKPGEERVEFRIFDHAGYNVNANKTVSFDPFKVHHFNYDGKNIVSVMEPEGLETVYVEFEEVGFSQSGQILGYLVIRSSVGKFTSSSKQEPGHLFFEVKKSVVPLGKPMKAPGKIKVTMESIECTAADEEGRTDDIFGLIISNAYSLTDSVANTKDKLPYVSNTGPAKCDYGAEEILWCLKCPLMLEFTKGHKSTFGSSLTYDFPVEGYLEITGNLDKANSANCSSIDALGVPQKKIIMTSEIGAQPYRFSQYFGSGKTMMKVNYRVEKTR